MSDELPEGWARARIVDVFEVNPRKPAADHVSEGTPVSFVPMGAVDADRGAITSPEERTFGAVRKGYTAFADGDVLLAKITPCFENGKAAVASSLRNGLGFGSSEFHVFRPQGAVVAPYLFHFLRQPQLRADVAEFMTGTAGQARVPIDQLSDLELPIAPLAEQRRIVAKVEALLEQVRRAKDRLDRVPLILKRFRQAALAAACTGQLSEAWRATNPNRHAPARPLVDRVARTRRQGANISKDGELLIDEMPDLPNSWAYWRADEVVDPKTAVTYGIVLPGPEHSGGVPYVRQQDIVDGGILVNALRRTTPAIAAKHVRSTLRAGDVLLCIIRNLRIAIVPKGLDGANLTQGTVRLRPGQHVRGDYLAAYLAGPSAQSWMKSRYFGMDMPRINVEDARAIPIALPPLDEQDAIMRTASALLRLADNIERRLKEAATQVAALPQAILSKAFAGELVATEAARARAEDRRYETAADLLRHLTSEGRRTSAGRPQERRKTAQTHKPIVPAANVRQGRPSELPPIPERAPTLALDEEVAMSALALLHAAGGTIARADLARAFVLRSNPDLLRDLAPTSLTQVHEWVARVNARTVPSGKLVAVLRLLEERGAMAFSISKASQSVVTIGSATPPKEKIHAWFTYEAHLALLVLPTVSSPRLKLIHKRLAGEDRSLVGLAS